jgi:hypothetical protein
VALDFRTIRNTLISHALASGQFDSVNAHPPDAVPGTGVHAIVEFASMRRASSGLASTSMRVVLTVSVYLSVEQEPADDIDPRAVDAADALYAAYIGDFELGGNVRNIDVTELAADAGYARVGGVELRAVVIAVPVVVNDVYAEAP